MASLTFFLGGMIRTMDSARPVAGALAARDGRIVAVGGAEDVLGLRTPDAHVVDLAGRTLIPGFVDPHTHFSVGALEGFWADCRTPPLGTVAEIQATLRAATLGAPAGEWVRGWGYRHASLAERRHPTRHDLDEAVPDRPVFLLHFSHHQGVANSRALAAAGITRATPDPPGGEVARDKGGEPTGLLFERAMSAVERASREGWERRFPEVAAEACRRFAAVGLTAVQDAAVSPAMERRYREAADAGALLIRVERMAVSPAGWFEPPWESARESPAGGWLKCFVDGGYRCAMRLTREGREVTSGFLFYRQEELAELLVTAWRAGWRGVTCHAIGNLGVETCVGAVEAALRREPVGAGRVRLDHAMFLGDDLIRRIAALGIRVVGQPSFVYDLGPGPVVAGLHVRPFGTLRAAGIPQAFSSDFPCGTLAPLTGIYAAVTRRARSGEAGDPEEAVPVEAALQAYTLDAARAAGLDAECGSLEAGKRADLVLLSGDPLATPPEGLPGLRVVATWVEGRVVYAQPGRPAPGEEKKP